jgi:hypothetical protein
MTFGALVVAPNIPPAFGVPDPVLPAPNIVGAPSDLKMLGAAPAAAPEVAEVDSPPAPVELNPAKLKPAPVVPLPIEIAPE